MDSLQIKSQNVRGLSNEKKRRKLFTWFHKSTASIILLQETHSSTNMEMIWKSEWGGDIIFAHGTGAARGACILFKNSVAKSIHNTILDPNGRYVIIDMEIDDVRFTLANVYGPNEDNPEFYCKLIEIIETLPNDNRIIGGDFNFVLDIELDKKGGRDTTNSRAQSCVRAWMESTDLIDIWRLQHPEDRKYTWHRKNPANVFCRLDFFVISFGLADRVECSDVKFGLLSDHSAICLDISFNNNPRGRGFWKYNCSLINDREYVDLVKTTVNTTVVDNAGTDDILLWDTIKCQIRGATIKYSASKRKKKRNELLILENKLEELQKQYIINQSTTIETKIEEIKININKEVDNMTRGAS